MQTFTGKATALKYSHGVEKTETILIAGDITLTINVAALIKSLGSQAIRNKNGKAKLHGGDIVATATNRNRVNYAG